MLCLAKLYEETLRTLGRIVAYLYGAESDLSCDL